MRFPALERTRSVVNVGGGEGWHRAPLALSTEFLRKLEHSQRTDLSNTNGAITRHALGGHHELHKNRGLVRTASHGNERGWQELGYPSQSHLP